MSDSESGTRAGPSRVSKRRKLVACDMCRRRKIKCDEKLSSTGKCSNCSEFGWSCTYAQAPTKLFAPGYVEALELKVQRLESFIKRVLPGRDFTREVGYKITRTNWMEPGVLGTPYTSEMESPSVFVPSGSDTHDAQYSRRPRPVTSVNASELSTPPVKDSVESDDEDGDLITKIQHLSLSGPAIIRSWGFSNYLGRSSTVGIVLVASKLLRQLHGPSHGSHFKLETTPKWISQYMYEQEASVAYCFPETDLLSQLVDLYFQHMNAFTPILHRPTFQRELSGNLHLKNRAFGGVTLLVCALGALVSDDPRVIIPSDGDDWHSAGWAWFKQVQVMDRSFVCGEKLYGLQIAALAALFMARSFSPVHAWMFAGFGIRLAQNVGAHKQRAYGNTITSQDEQYRRVTWVLFRFDILLSKGLGRPCNIQEDEFDLALPQCCDDEYWTNVDPDQVFKQPEGKPSYMCYFICTIKLSQIMHSALRTIYASTKTKTQSGFTGDEWLLRTITHFDSLLNDWSDSVPDHLRDPSRADGLHFMQSIGLWLFYHEMRIVIHRPFIVPFDDKSKPFPSFTTCINSSRSLVSLMTALEERRPDQVVILPAEAICNAAILSLIVIAAHKLYQTTFDIEHAQRDVAACLDILRRKARRWRWGSRFLHILDPLMAIFDAPNILHSQSRSPWKPEEVSSWLPAATGRNTEFTQPELPNEDSDLTEYEYNQNSTEGLDWDLDWSLLQGFPSEYSMDPFTPMTVPDIMEDGLRHMQSSSLSVDPAFSEGLDLGGSSTILSALGCQSLTNPYYT